MFSLNLLTVYSMVCAPASRFGLYDRLQEKKRESFVYMGDGV